MNHVGNIQPVRAKLQTTDTTILTGTKERLQIMAIWLCNTHASNRTVDLTVTSDSVDYELLKTFVITGENKEIIQAQGWPVLTLNEGEVLKGLCSGANDDVHIQIVTTTLGTADIGTPF